METFSSLQTLELFGIFHFPQQLFFTAADAVVLCSKREL